MSSGYSKSYVQQQSLCSVGPGPLTPAYTSIQMFLPPSTTLPYKPSNCYGSYFRPLLQPQKEYVDPSQYKTTPKTTKFPAWREKCKSCSR